MNYVQLFKRQLIERRNAELEVDLIKLEDRLNLDSIVAARMQAKIIVSILVSRSGRE